jgi:trigger factor
MEVLLEKSTPTNATLKIALTPTDYQPVVDKTIKDYSKRVNLKGYRPGKVPMQVVQKMYGKGLLIDEVNKMVSTAINDYIKDNKLQVVGDPIINREKAVLVEWGSQENYDFEYELGLASDFEVNLASLPVVSSYTILAGEKELNETIENLQKQFSEQKSVDASEEGDMIFGELKQGEFTTKTAIPFKRIKEDKQATFIGLNKGGSISFDIRTTFNEDKDVAMLTGLKEEEAAALAGDFELQIEDITRQAPSELNQAFFDKVLGAGKVDNEETFRSEVHTIINSNYSREADALLRRDTELALLDNIKIDLPDEFLKKWLVEVNEGKFTAEQIDSEYDAFCKSMKLSLIRNKVADTADIKIDYQEILGRTENMVREQFGMYGNDLGGAMDETIKKIAANYLNEKEGENYKKVFNDVFDEKVMNAIKNQIPLSPKDIDVEQFKAIVEEVK